MFFTFFLQIFYIFLTLFYTTLEWLLGAKSICYLTLLLAVTIVWMVYECLIIGGGISGLGAGKTLLEHGITDILIVDSRERLGGRIFSQKMAHGFHAELGAEWIGKTHKHLLKLIQELDPNHDELQLIDHTFGFHNHLHISNVSTVTNKLYHAHTEKLQTFLASFDSWKDKKIKTYDDYNLEALLLELGIDILGREDLDLKNSNEFGETIKTLSASRFIIHCLTGGANLHCDYKIKQGNATLIDKLLELIGEERIVTGKSIISIEKKKHHYLLTCQDGTVYKSKYILCTIPLHAFHHIDRHGLLGSKKQELMHQIPYGRILKCGFLLEKQLKLDENYALLDDSLLHTIYNTGKGIDGGSKNLVGIYSTGERGFLLSKFTTDEIFQELQQIEEFQEVSQFEDTYRYYRGEDPYTAGAFALVPPGFCYKLPKIFSRHDGHIFYSGEHCSLKFQGFMEGALETGIRQAKKIARRINK